MSDPFGEDWFGEASQTKLAELAGLVADVDGLVVEVGSWTGRSTCALANAVHPRVVHAVDTWAGSPGELSAELASQRDIYAEWVANVAEFTKGNVKPQRMGWREYAALSDQPLAFVFIDAEHTEVEVRENIEALLPRLAPGGVICGDDVHHPPVQAGVCAALPVDEVKVGATLWWWRKPRNARLAELYADVCATPSDIYLHLPRFVELVEALDARHVIELGTRTGVSTIAWLHALAGTGGRLTSVDIDECPPIGEFDHWTFIRGDDCDPAVLGQLEPADIVFLDTSHRYSDTVRELNTYRWLVKPGGVIVCHDTELPWPEAAQPGDPRFPVKTAITEFCAENNFEWINYESCWGLGVIKVP